MQLGKGMTPKQTDILSRWGTNAPNGIGGVPTPGAGGTHEP